MMSFKDLLCYLFHPSRPTPNYPILRYTQKNSLRVGSIIVVVVGGGASFITCFGIVGDRPYRLGDQIGDRPYRLAASAV